MRTIGNILWMLFFGLWSAVSWFFLGLLWCVTIVGIPFGKQCFKIAGLVFWPFKKDVDTNFGKHPVANIIWIIFGGLELAMAYVVGGAICCITVIGIPFGKQCFKLAALSLAPFGAKVK
ncbi:MAG: YccF domain-containing protein [Lachnospiraceae bacterium]|nr:YccF domain-containing protein [Lachnospiraceae bacterium]